MSINNNWHPVASSLEGPKLCPWESGPTVIELQELLNAHGFRLRVDGDFGEKTAAAVATYQRQHGLKIDGIVGNHTWAALKTTVQPGCRSLRVGHTGVDVFELQWLLQICGYDVMRDGIFAEETKQVVIAFQQRHKLQDVGWVDRITWQMLRGSSLPLPTPPDPKKPPSRWS
jgi:peptidoglycan hydrolase-like protein with peptidoglycan-binding domain